MDVVESNDGAAIAVERSPLMIVEDDKLTLKILKKRLEVAGYAVDSAENGQVAWELYQEKRHPLILSDWMMPEMDGRELCSRIKATPHGRESYFIILTARDRREDIVDALDTGADEYLVKPCDGDELMARVRAAERILQLRRHLKNTNDELKQAHERIRDEIRAVASIQQNLLPASLPASEYFEFASHYQPSTECSGDFYDILPQADGRMAVLVGDVSGHGGPAMVAMALVRMLLHQQAAHYDDPADLLHCVNNEMFRHLPTDQYLTLFYALLDPATGRLDYSSAGHTAPLWFRKDTRAVELLPHCEGFPIKLVGEDMEYETHSMTLAPGDRLMIYTDGLPEAFNEDMEMLGIQRVVTFMQELSSCPPAHTINHILGRLTAFIGAHPLEDDLTMLVLQRKVENTFPMT